MKGVLIAGVVLLAFAGSSVAQPDVKVELFADQDMTQCTATLFETGCIP